jgi:hypothetical protein
VGGGGRERSCQLPSLPAGLRGKELFGNVIKVVGAAGLTKFVTASQGSRVAYLSAILVFQQSSGLATLEGNLFSSSLAHDLSLRSLIYRLFLSPPLDPMRPENARIRPGECYA